MRQRCRESHEIDTNIRLESIVDLRFADDRSLFSFACIPPVQAVCKCCLNAVDLEALYFID